MVLLAKCVDNALFREKIIDKEIRRKLYRNGVFADLIASFSMIVISFIKNLSDLPSYFSGFENYVVYFSMSLFSFMYAPDYSQQNSFFISFLFILVTIAISALISLFYCLFSSGSSGCGFIYLVQWIGCKSDPSFVVASSSERRGHTIFITIKN